MQSKHIILVGGGHTHVLTVNALKKNLPPHVTVTLIEPQTEVPYTGMLPGLIAGHYTSHDISINMRDLCGTDTKITHIQDRVVAVRPHENSIVLASGQSLRYDAASFDIGIHTEASSIKGFTDHATPVKPLGEFARTWQQYVARSNESVGTKNHYIAIIGGGLAGVETALAMAHRIHTPPLASHDPHTDSSHITLIDQGRILSTLGQRARKFLLEELQRYNIHIYENVAVSQITRTHVHLETNKKIPAHFVLGATGAQPYTWLRETNIPLEEGFISVNEHLQSTGFENIFATGDCTSFIAKPLPKAGVYAVRQAPTLTHNLLCTLQQKPLKIFTPQKHYLKLISLGEKRACADKWGLCVHGKPLWFLKDFIDRQFVSQFTDQKQDQKNL